MFSKNKSFFNVKNLFLGLTLLALNSYVGQIWTINQQLLLDTTFTGYFNVDPLPQIQDDIKNGADVNAQDPTTGNTPLLNLLLTAQDGPVNFNLNYRTLLNDINYLLSVPNINPELTNKAQVTPLAAVETLWNTLYQTLAANPSKPSSAEINAAPIMVNLTIIQQNITDAGLLYIINNGNSANFNHLVYKVRDRGAQINVKDVNGQTPLHHTILSNNLYIDAVTGTTGYINNISAILGLTRLASGDYWMSAETLNALDNTGMSALMYAAKSTNTLISNNNSVTLEAVQLLLARPDIYVNQVNPLDGNKTALDYAVSLANSGKVTGTQLTTLQAVIQAIGTAGKNSKVINAAGETTIA